LQAGTTLWCRIAFARSFCGLEEAIQIFRSSEWRTFGVLPVALPRKSLIAAWLYFRAAAIRLLSRTDKMIFKNTPCLKVRFKL
jgi:hypothetical protein